MISIVIAMDIRVKQNVAFKMNFPCDLNQSAAGFSSILADTVEHHHHVGSGHPGQAGFLDGAATGNIRRFLSVRIFFSLN